MEFDFFLFEDGLVDFLGSRGPCFASCSAISLSVSASCFCVSNNRAACPSKPDGKQVINTKIIINAVEGGKQKSKILLNGKPLEKREGTVSK